MCQAPLEGSPHQGFGLAFLRRPLAYRAYAVSVAMYTARLVPLDNTMLMVQHMAIARIFASPMYALSPGIAAEFGAMGSRPPPRDLRPPAWAERLRAALCFPVLALGMRRADVAILADRCLAPGMGDWFQRNIMADLRIALHYAAGLPPKIQQHPDIQEHPEPQSAIVRMPAAEVGVGRLRDRVSRRKARLLGEAVHPSCRHRRQPLGRCVFVARPLQLRSPPSWWCAAACRPPRVSAEVHLRAALSVAP